MDLSINGHDRCQSASAQAGHGLQGKQAVRGGLPLSGQTQSVPQAVLNGSGFAHVACRAGAYLDDVPALGLQREILIESGHAVHLCRADAQLFRDQGQRSLAQVLILPLDCLLYPSSCV